MGMDVEWMYGDSSRLSVLNPLRWSGSLTFESAMGQLGALEMDVGKISTGALNGRRPIFVKIPSGLLTSKKTCSDVDDAIKYIKSKSPAHIAAEIEKLNKGERDAALKQQFEKATEDAANYVKDLEKHEKLETDAKNNMDDAKMKMDEAVAEAKA